MISVEDHGENNVVEVPAEYLAMQNGRFMFLGSNNRLVLGKGCTSKGVGFTLGDNCNVVIGNNCQLAAFKVFMKHGGHVGIGDNVAFTWETKIFLHEHGSVRIGPHCLIGSGSLLTCSDMHSIIDLDSGRRINASQNIAIGEHVWIGEDVKVLKGAVIGDDCVIGMSSIVTKEIPPNCVAAGVPARVVRKGVTWDHRLLPT